MSRRKGHPGVTKRDWFYKWLHYLLALLPVWWLDAYILTRFPVFGVTPLLLPVAVTAVGVLEGVAGGAGFGFGVGLLWATAYAGSAGERVILLTLVGMLAGALAQSALARTLLGCVVCSACALAAIELLALVRELFFLRSDLWPMLRVAIPQLLWSLVWTPLIYGLFSRVYDRVGGDRLV